MNKTNPKLKKVLQVRRWLVAEQIALGFPYTHQELRAAMRYLLARDDPCPSSQPRHAGFGHPVAGRWETAPWRG